MSGRPAVFLDRDGVINEATTVEGVPHSPRTAQGLQLLPGVVETCQALAAAGLVLVVVTNQPDVARGLLPRVELEAMHSMLLSSLPLTAVYVCTHDDADNCYCRKPAPGMLLDSSERLGLDLQRSVMVGDRWKDIEAAERAGVHSVFIDRGYRELLRSQPDAVFSSLADACEHILKTTQHAATN